MEPLPRALRGWQPRSWPESCGYRQRHEDVPPRRQARYNVLLTLDHGPQLLDFNLAESPHSAGQAESAMLGGTLSLHGSGADRGISDPNLWNKVGAQADIYSLGLVIRELLTGQAPDLPDEKLPPPRAMSDLLERRTRLVTDVGQFNPSVPPCTPCHGHALALLQLPRIATPTHSLLPRTWTPSWLDVPLRLAVNPLAAPAPGERDHAESRPDRRLQWSTWYWPVSSACSGSVPCSSLTRSPCPRFDRQ